MGDYRFSANLGFLWKDLPFLDRIAKAAAHGFDAMEFHDDAQRADRAALKDALAAASLPIVGLNCRMGETSGCAALPEQADQARADIDDAVALATDIGAACVHVVAGRASGAEAEAAYLATLRYALAHSPDDLTIVIEPISHRANPGFFLSDLVLADRVLETLGHPRLKLLFDCFHVAAMGEDVATAFARRAAQVGHIQIASFPARAEPWPASELDYAALLPGFQDAGYAGCFGCEYTPSGELAPALAWRDRLRAES